MLDIKSIVDKADEISAMNSSKLVSTKKDLNIISA